MINKSIQIHLHLNNIFEIKFILIGQIEKFSIV